MPEERPFVDFYTEKGLTPTRQDIADLPRHMQRRGSLYKHLGILPSYLRDRSVLEFGPGSGHNSVFTASCHPHTYVLVDATPSSLACTKELLDEHAKIPELSVVESNILEFETDKRFDLVLCEGVIPTQLDPSAFLRHVASFVAPGGVLVFTCMDSVSLLPELLRRYIAYQLIEGIDDFNEQVATLVSFFKPDLNSLQGMSRHHEDWVIDQILHPWSGPLYSIPEAVEAIKDNFEFYGASPSFVVDWRWYKQICGDDYGFNHLASEAYFSQLHNFIDHRFLFEPQPEDNNRRIKDVADTIYDNLIQNERKKKVYSPDDIAADVSSICQLLPDGAKETVEGFEEFNAAIPAANYEGLNKFRKIWGRGQQYLSFIRQ